MEAAYSMACEEMAAKAAAMIAEAEAAEAEQPAVRSPEAVLAEEALVEAREAASLLGAMRQEALRLCDESDSADDDEEEEEVGDEDGAADHDEWACFADGITSPSVPVFSVGVDDLDGPEAQVGATAPACDAGPQAVQSVEIPEDEPIGSYTDDSEDPESAFDPEYAARTSSTQLDAALAQQVGVDTEAIFGEAGASGLVRGGGSLNHLAAIRQALAPRPGTFGNAPVDSSTDVAARRPPSKNGPALAAQICREVREAEAEAELEFLSPAARLDAARKEQESSQARAARQWESELARAERRASLPMVTLLRDEEDDDTDAVDKGANEEGGDAEQGGGRGSAGGAAAVTPSAAAARSRVSRCVHSGGTWTWDSRELDEPIPPEDDRVEMPAMCTRRKRRSEWKAPASISPQARRSRDRPMPPLPRLLPPPLPPPQTRRLQRQHAPGSSAAAACRSYRAFRSLPASRSLAVRRTRRCLPHRRRQSARQLRRCRASRRSPGRALPQQSARRLGGRPTAGERGKPRRRRRSTRHRRLRRLRWVALPSPTFCRPRSWGNSPIPDILKGMSDRLKAQQQ